MLLLTRDEMRALDRRTIDGGHATGLELMRRAGTGVVESMEARYGSVLGLRALVLCGTGNNGGDGFVAARRLRERGATVHAALVGDAERVGDDARQTLEAAQRAGIRVDTATTEEGVRAIAGGLDHWDFALDALLGTGAHGPLTAPIAAGVQILRELDEQGTRVVAVDLPTGIDSDTGEIARRAVRADLTVTFGAPKRGHYLYPGRAFVGDLDVVDIGLVTPEPDEPLAQVSVASAREIARLVPLRDPRAHKGSSGRVLVIGGSPGLTGAVTLAARAASRAGAGYVQVAVPESLHDVMAAKLTEQMPVPCPETPGRTLSLAAFDALGPYLERVDAVAIGPGLSRNAESAALACRIVAEVTLPVLVDADALNAIANDLAALGRAAGPRVLTPHVGEMSRLTGQRADSLESRRIDAPRTWAQRWNAVVVFKGAPTVVASADHCAVVNPTGNPGMATAGTGDVLTGVIAALLAQRLTPANAAVLGAYVHGMAGDRIARARGELGLVAGDLLDTLPSALHELERHERAATARAVAERLR